MSFDVHSPGELTDPLRGDPGEAPGLIPGAGLAERCGEDAGETRPPGLDHRPVESHRPAARGKARPEGTGANSDRLLIVRQCGTVDGSLYCK